MGDPIPVVATSSGPVEEAPDGAIPMALYGVSSAMANDVNVVASVLPTGAATEVNLTLVGDTLDQDLQEVKQAIVDLKGTLESSSAETNDLLETIDTDLTGDLSFSAASTLPVEVTTPVPITDNGGSITVDVPGGVTVTNPVTEVEVTNQPTELDVTVLNPTTETEVTNFPTEFDVTVLNPVNSVSVNNAVTVANPVTSVTVSGTVAVSNPVNSVTVLNPTTDVNTTPKVSATSPTLTTYRTVNLNSTPLLVKASAGRVHQYSVYNVGNAVAYLHLWNAPPGGITLGTTNPLMTIAIPGRTTLDGYWPVSHEFTSAISVSLSSSSNGTGTVTASTATLGYV